MPKAVRSPAFKLFFIHPIILKIKQKFLSSQIIYMSAFITYIIRT